MAALALSAMTEDVPTAMLAKGPACTSTGVPCIVCMSVGCTVSLRRMAAAPDTPKSRHVTGWPWRSDATTMRSIRSLKSCQHPQRDYTCHREAKHMSTPCTNKKPRNAETQRVSDIMLTIRPCKHDGSQISRMSCAEHGLPPQYTHRLRGVHASDILVLGAEMGETRVVARLVRTTWVSDSA